MAFYNLGLAWRSVALDGEGRPALIYSSEKSVSFEQLNAYADALGGLLLARGLYKGDVVAIANEKTPFAYAAMIACLKLGMPYVCLDSASPLERLRKICDTAAPRLLLYDDKNFEQNARILEFETFLLDRALLADLPRADLRAHVSAVDGETLAYIMFTSGSTGVPKGVAVAHGNALRFMDWGKTRFQIDESDIVAQLSPMYFDNSVFDFYAGLFSGAALAPIHRKLLNSPYDLVHHVGQTLCTIWFSVPSLLIYLMTMKAMRPEVLPALRSISFGGEGYPKTELKKLFDLFSPATILTNVYGPTECTCICASHRLSSADFKDLHGLPCLGILNPDFDYRIENCDAEGRGELVLMGPQVAAGYFNDPKRTQQSFFVCRKPQKYGKRAYRTGDMVREENGHFYFLGRMDNQIKHMGYRIELEEIEAALMELPGVNQACAVYIRANDAFGKIVAFIAHENEPNPQELLKNLTQYLPAYMIPSKLTCMKELPKNANGKIDRKALQLSCQPQTA